MNPSTVVSVPNGYARFYCIHMFTSTDAGVIWLVNDTVWNGTYTLDCASVEAVTSGNGIVGIVILEFMNISLTCNVTRVQCLINTVMSNEALLLIQSES